MFISKTGLCGFVRAIGKNLATYHTWKCVKTEPIWFSVVCITPEKKTFSYRPIITLYLYYGFKFPSDLENKIPGKLSQHRWLTTGNRIFAIVHH